MTTIVLKLTPREAAHLEAAGHWIGKTREEAAKAAIRLFLRSMPEQPATSGKKKA